MPDNAGFNPSLHLLRGIVIVLVILGHAITPAYDNSGSRLETVNSVIHAFHMHTFFFLSGFFGSKFFFVSRGSAGRIVVNQLKRLLLVYFFYSLLGILLKVGVPSSMVYRPLNWGRLLTDILLYPQQNPLLLLWFIYSLFLVQMLFLCVSVVLRPDYRRPTTALFVLLLLAAASYFSVGTPLNSLLGWSFVTRYAVYFFLGFMAGQRGDAIQQRLLRGRHIILAGGLIYFSALLPAWEHLPKMWFLGVIYALAGIAVSWTLAIQLAVVGGQVAGVVKCLADYSYEIYLNGGVMQAATRIVVRHGLVAVLPWMADAWRPVLLASGVAIGLIGPILLTRYVYSRNVWLRRLAMGQWRQAAAATKGAA
ncbi:MAG TPA: acyltransferase family protein [Phycisphaerae bacterium]|nr:acyltransferase family protein [Phycisphaerae bacterium]